MRPSSLSVAALFLTAITGLGYDPIETVPADFKMPGPLPLKESLKSFQTKPGLRIELVAAEPLVMDPINLDWGPDGKLWVVEMADYPLGMDGKSKPGGRVRFLTDTNGDGKYDRSTLFLDGLNFPTAVKWWKNGVLVVAAPEIFYAEDSDGDGKADKREVLYRGFREGNQQHRVNGLIWGGDGWLHLANGDSGGTVESVKTGEKLDLGGFDLRIRPGTGEMERTSGRTQYGRAKDDHGNWFGCSNSRPFFHFVLPDRFLRRNSHVIYPKAAIELTPSAPKVYPIGEPAHRYNNAYSLGHITSACGLTIYRDDRLGEGFRGNAFVCEPVHNLVTRRILEPDGVTFKARRASDEKESEFLASSDTWFRPTAALTGPDGGLWVVDMHRFVIEHPEWIPAPWQKVLDLRAGQDRGRIYRVVSDACAESVVSPDLTGFSDLPDSDQIEERGVSFFRSGWVRDTLVQLYVPQPPPTDLAGRMEELSRPGVNPKQREAMEKRLRNFPDSPAIVELKVAFAAGESDSEELGNLLARLALKHSGDSHFVAGAMSSLVPHVETVAAEVAKAEPKQRAPLLPYLFETAIGTGNAAALITLLDNPSDSEAGRFETFASFLKILDRRSLSIDRIQEKMPALKEPLGRLSELAASARKRAGDETVAAEARIAAFAMLGRVESDTAADRKILVSALGVQSPISVQQAAVRRLIEIGESDRWFSDWNTFTPAVHRTIVSRCLENRNLTGKLLTAIESGQISAKAIDTASQDRLKRYPNAEIRKRAKAVLDAGSSKNRAAVVAEYKSALEIDGDPGKGRTVFQTACAICHQLDGVGRDLGANLAALADKSGPSLLAAILDPNRAVEDKYLLYEVKLRSGENLAGMIADESGDSLTLSLLDGSEKPVLRSQVESVRSTGRSAMPEGLEAALNPQQIADLIAFIQQAGGLPE